MCTTRPTNLEKDFDDLLQDGQKTTVMNAHSSLQQRQDSLDLRSATLIKGTRPTNKHKYGETQVNARLLADFFMGICFDNEQKAKEKRRIQERCRQPILWHLHPSIRGESVCENNVITGGGTKPGFRGTPTRREFSSQGNRSHSCWDEFGQNTELEKRNNLVCSETA